MNMKQRISYLLDKYKDEEKLYCITLLPKQTFIDEFDNAAAIA